LPRTTLRLRASGPKRAALTDQAEPDVLAYMSFPAAQRRKPHSTNPLERLNGQIKRRARMGWRTPKVPSPTGRWAWKLCADARTISGTTRQFDLRKRVNGWSGQVRETPQVQRPRDRPGRESKTGVVRTLVPRHERCNACLPFGVCVADAMWSSFRTRAQVCCWRHEFHLEQATPRTSLAVDYLQ
jgi:hypothetical protein